MADIPFDTDAILGGAVGPSVTRAGRRRVLFGKITTGATSGDIPNGPVGTVKFAFMGGNGNVDTDGTIFRNSLSVDTPGGGTQTGGIHFSAYANSTYYVRIECA